ncbi:MAG: FecR domain-containing protein [Pseudomonadota bacterium]
MSGIEETARNWAVYLHSDAVDPERLEAFEAWIAEDAAHAKAYREYAQLMGDLSLMPELDDVSSQKDVFLKKTAASAWISWPVRELAAAAAVMIAFVSIIGLQSVVETQPDAVSVPMTTQIAEIRDETLADGSVVTLGARSRIDALFSETARQVTLLEGEAFFDVVSDPDRPFYVAAGDRMIRVVGTKFAVRHGTETLKVSVAEGVVEVLRAETPAQAEKIDTQNKEILRAGDQILVAVADDIEIRSNLEPNEAGSWRRGWLKYENASLEEVVADVNRYDERRLVFASADLKGIRVTAAFGVDTIDQFIAGLTASHPIDADISDSNEIILSRRN